MNKKIIVIVLAMASLVMFLPSTGNAAEMAKTSPVNVIGEYNYSPQVRIRIGQPRRRYNRRVYIRRGYGPRRRVRVVRRVYYRNGRRYVTTRRY